MGALTLGTIISETTAALGGRDDLTQSRVSLYANLAHRVIWDLEGHERAEAIAVSSTTSGENRITLPTDFQEATIISNTSSQPPTPLTQWNVNALDSATTLQGAPTHYVLYNGYLELYPTPDSAYSLQLRYKTAASTLTSTAATSSFATRYDLAWLYKTTELTAKAVRDWESAAVARTDFLNEIATVPSDLALRQRARLGMSLSLPHPTARPSSDSWLW